jgi:hypothetical protein
MTVSSTLSHSPAEILQQLMVDEGIVVEPLLNDETTSWQAYVSSEPSMPDNCVTVQDTVGTQDGRTVDGRVPAGEINEHPGWQIRVRAVSHRVGFLKLSQIRKELMEQVYDAFVQLQDDLLVNHVYSVQAITRIGSIVMLGTDAPDTKRSLFTLSGTMAVTEVTNP